MNTNVTFALKWVGKNWASPFFPHPDKVKRQPYAEGYQVGKNWASPFFPHPDKVKHQPYAEGNQVGKNCCAYG